MSVDFDVLVSNFVCDLGRGVSGCQFLKCPAVASGHRLAVLLIPIFKCKGCALF